MASIDEITFQMIARGEPELAAAWRTIAKTQPPITPPFVAGPRLSDQKATFLKRQHRAARLNSGDPKTTPSASAFGSHGLLWISTILVLQHSRPASVFCARFQMEKPCHNHPGGDPDNASADRGHNPLHRTDSATDCDSGVMNGDLGCARSELGQTVD